MKQGGLISAGILSAIVASLCCITPVLALIAGTTGAASTFSWIEPARPYLIGFTVLVLGYAWYQKFKHAKVETKDCCSVEKPSFWQSKLFLGIITVLSVLMLSFPYYSRIFYSNNQKQVILTNISGIQKAEFKISGMTCQSCEDHVKHEVNKLPGIIGAIVSYAKANASIEFDTTQTTIDQITEAINSTGYKTTEVTINK